MIRHVIIISFIGKYLATYAEQFGLICLILLLKNKGILVEMSIGKVLLKDYS